MGKEEITLRNYYYWKNEIDAFLNEKEDKSNKTSSWNSETNDNRYPTEKLVKTTLDTKENTSNKISSWNSTTNNTRYPTEKLVKTSLDGKINTSALVNDLTTGGTSKVLSAEQGKVLKGEVDGKSNLGHTHDDRYYTESEIDNKLASKENNNNKTLIWTNTPDNTRYPTEKLVKDSLDTKENTSNKTNSWNSTPNNTRYPTEKLVKDSLDNKINTDDSRLTDARDPKNTLIDASQGNAKNLNDYTNIGFYYCFSNNNRAKYVVNTPLNTLASGETFDKTTYVGSSNSSFYLTIEVGSSSNFIKQTLTYYSTGKTYIRVNNSGDWTDWKQLSTADHTHPNATTSTNGLMSSTDKAKLDEIENGANAYTHPSYTARTGKPTGNQTPAFGGTATVSQITSDSSGHVTGATDRTIKIPNTEASTTASGLMSKDDKTKLDGISTGAKNVSVEAKGSGTIEIAQITVDGTTTSIKQRDNNTTYTAASATPNMDGTGAVGTSAKYAREDHVHPTDTSRASTTVTDNLQTQINNITDGTTPTDHNHDSQYIKTTDGSVGTNNLANSAVTSAKIANGTIKNEDISTSAAIAQSKINNLTNDLAAKNITLTKLSTPTNNTYIATYEIKQGETSIGKIDIPKDFLIQSASLEHCTTANTPLEGLNVGDPYIHFVANTNDGTQTAKTIDINVKDLVDTYKADNSTLQLNTSTNTFSIKSQGVTTTQIKNGTIINEDISSNAAISQSKIDGLITDLSGKSDNGHTHSQYLTSHQDISGKENTSNKTSSWKSTTNNTRYPTEKLVKDSLDEKISKSILIDASAGHAKDLNTYGDVGFYYCFSNTDRAKYVANAPNTMLSSDETFDEETFSVSSHQSFYLIVEESNSIKYKKQTLTYWNNGDTYIRIKTANNGTASDWKSWEKVASINDIPNVINNLNSTSTTDSLSAAQGKTLKTEIDNKSTVSYTQTGTGTVEIGKINIDGTEIAIKQRDNNTTYTKAANTPPADTTDGTVGTVNKYALENHSHPKSDLYAEASHQHTKSEITDFPTSMTPTSHTHGNITNAGAIGSTANLPIITTTSGKLTTGSFGTAANTFCQGNDSRLNNTRTPTDGSVTNAKVASNAAIDFSKLNITKNDITGLGIPASDTNTTYTADESTITKSSGNQFSLKDSSNYVKKSSTTGYIKNDGTIGTPTNTTYSADESTITKSSSNQFSLKDSSNYVKKSSTSGYIKNDGTIGTPTNTTYGADRGISNVSGKFGHSNTAITAQTTSALKKIEYDTYGHITGTDDVDASDLPSHTHTSLERTRELAPTINTSTDNDLNKLTVPGWYNVIKANAQLETIANIPEENVAFRIEVQGQTQNNNYLTQIVYTTPTSTTFSNVYYRKRYGSYWSNWQKVLTLQNSANDTASNIKINGTQSAGSLDTFARADHVHPVDTSRAASSHTHGNITNAGAIGSTANKPIITTTSGKLIAGSFGTTANTFCEGDDSRLSDARTPLAHTHKGWDQKSSSNNWRLYVNSDLGLAFFRYDAGVPGGLSNNTTFDILTSGATVTNSPLHGTSFTTENPYLSAWITAEGYVQVWTSDKSKFSKLIFSGFYLTTA